MDTKASQVLGTVRILKLSFIGAGLLFLYVVFKVPANGTTHPQPAFEVIIGAIALTNIVLGFILPRFIARAGRSQSSARPSTPTQR